MEIKNRICGNLWVIAIFASAGALTACSGSSPPGGGGTTDAGTEIDPTSAPAVRSLIGSQIPGGIAKLQVPALDKDIPVPPAPAAYPGRFDITEAKRYLGYSLQAIHTSGFTCSPSNGQVVTDCTGGTMPLVTELTFSVDVIFTGHGCAGMTVLPDPNNLLPQPKQISSGTMQVCVN